MQGVARSAARGFALIDSLIALLVLSLGLLALGQCVSRQLAEIRTTQARQVALQYIDAAAEHLRLAQAPPTGPAMVHDDELPDDWRASLEAALPGASAQLLRTAAVPPEIAIVIGWPANERFMGADDARRQQGLMEAPLSGSGLACPPRHLCHIAYVRP